MIKSVIFISVIKAIIKFLIAALSVNKLLERTALELIALVWFAFVLQNAPAGRTAQSIFTLSRLPAAFRHES